MEESRKQFEAWFHSRYDQISMPPVERSMLFTNQWASWQASRAAIEIELPDKVMVEDEFDNGHNVAIDYCADAIRAAGLTVKGDR
ncbi:hypothetical protein [Atlantibacter hermannii]|uniref:hypothetical protein n=1 Tax=Atlantibacter hermannii TaxID=565 RepID=UPI00289C709A|nr:hypothetical protein [Atlantibacter hermannii]